MHKFGIEGYKKLINEFLDAGYSFKKFELTTSLKNNIILRHDIDFCVKYAIDMAKIEKEMGIHSSFFFMVSNELYNPFANSNVERLENISKMGHSVCLHIDETMITCKDDFLLLLSSVKKLMPFLDTHVISRHRPMLNNKVLWLPDGVLDTYQSHFFSEMEYASDSKGEWRYGYPTLREAFKSGKSYQLLTHPVWWTSNDSSKKKILKMLKEREYDGAKSISYLNNI